MKKSKILKISITIILIILTISISLLIKYTLSLNDNINFSSSIYQIKNNYIKNISPYTTKELFNNYFDLSNCYIKVVDSNSKEITTDYIYTGSITQVYNNQNNLIYSYENIITGDITNDGLVNENDLEKLSEYIKETNKLSQTEILAIDIDNNQIIEEQDLNLLEEYLNSTYKKITLNKETLKLMTSEKERLIATIEPSIILNQNLTWTSSNESVAKVNNTGNITANQEGEAIITATTKDGTISASSKIIVDNTIELSSTSGIIYTGGDSLEIEIKSLDYQGITCKVENELVASCKIENNKLIVSPLNDGDTKITISSPKYGTAIYNVKTLFTYLNVLPHSACFPPYSSRGGGIISGFNFGNLSVKSISDKNIIWYASITNSKISISAGSKTGDAQVIFTESNGHKTSIFTAYVYKLSLEASSGTGAIGKEKTVKINNENAGDLSCKSLEEEKATCKIENNKLIITPLVEKKETTIKVTGNKCGEVEYKITGISDDSTLSSLTISNTTLNPTFKKNIYDYTATTISDTITIEAIPNHKNAKITGDIGNHKLNYGTNILKIIVTSEFNTTSTYTITVIKPLPNSSSSNNKSNNKTNNEKQLSNDASLKNITIKGYNLIFNKNTYLYNLNVKNNITKLNIKATPNNEKAKVEVEEKELVIGKNYITITVTAEDGTICKYTLIVTREKESNQEIIIDSKNETSNKKYNIMNLLIVIIIVLSITIITKKIKKHLDS